MKLTSGQQTAINILLKSPHKMTFNMLWKEASSGDGLGGFWFNTMYNLEKKGLVKKDVHDKEVYWSLLT